MRKLLTTAALAALLAACSPPAPQEKAETPTPTPVVEACNALTPDSSQQVTVQDELAVAAAAADLRGGRITPGRYDLTAATRIGRATGWNGTRAVALEVAENPSGGVVLNWAGAEPGGVVDTWTATFTEAPEPRIAYTCGRIGEVAADFTASATALELRLPDGANGSLHLNFARRP